MLLATRSSCRFIQYVKVTFAAGQHYPHAELRKPSLDDYIDTTGRGPPLQDMAKCARYLLYSIDHPSIHPSIHSQQQRLADEKLKLGRCASFPLGLQTSRQRHQ